jgi:hypothetical protein
MGIKIASTQAWTNMLTINDHFFSLGSHLLLKCPPVPSRSRFGKATRTDDALPRRTGMKNKNSFQKLFYVNNDNP